MDFRLLTSMSALLDNSVKFEQIKERSKETWIVVDFSINKSIN